MSEDCEQGTPTEQARISAVDPSTGAAETVVDEFEGRPLNSPNDVAVSSDGSIWFTDPSYGFLQGFKAAPTRGDYVYRFDGSLTIVEDSFDKPYGLAFSPDGLELIAAPIWNGGVDREAVVLEAATGKFLRTLRLPLWTPGDWIGFTLSPDGRTLAALASVDRVVLFSDTATGQLLGAQLVGSL